MATRKMRGRARYVVGLRKKTKKATSQRKTRAAQQSLLLLSRTTTCSRCNNRGHHKYISYHTKQHHSHGDAKFHLPRANDALKYNNQVTTQRYHKPNKKTAGTLQRGYGNTCTRGEKGKVVPSTTHSNEQSECHVHTAVSIILIPRYK